MSQSFRTHWGGDAHYSRFVYQGCSAGCHPVSQKRTRETRWEAVKSLTYEGGGHRCDRAECIFQQPLRFPATMLRAVAHPPQSALLCYCARELLLSVWSTRRTDQGNALPPKVIAHSAAWS